MPSPADSPQPRAAMAAVKQLPGHCLGAQVPRCATRADQMCPHFDCPRNPQSADNIDGRARAGRFVQHGQIPHLLPVEPALAHALLAARTTHSSKFQPVRKHPSRSPERRTRNAKQSRSSKLGSQLQFRMGHLGLQSAFLLGPRSGSHSRWWFSHRQRYGPYGGSPAAQRHQRSDLRVEPVPRDSGEYARRPAQFGCHRHRSPRPRIDPVPALRKEEHRALHFRERRHR